MKASWRTGRVHFPTIRGRSGVICETLFDERPYIEVTTDNRQDHARDMISDEMRYYKFSVVLVTGDVICEEQEQNCAYKLFSAGNTSFPSK